MSRLDRQVVKRPGLEQDAQLGNQDRRELSRDDTRADMGILAQLTPLLIVLGIIFGGLWLVRRYLPNQRLLVGNQGMEVLSRTAITNKQQVALVKVGKRILVLGVGGEQVSTLANLDDPHEIAQIMGDVASKQRDSITRSFSQLFKHEADVYVDSAEGHDEIDDTDSQVRGLLEKIRGYRQQRHVA